MIPVIISGGSGSRLWPISRTSYPKQFCEIFDEPLLEHTLKRVLPMGTPMIVTVQSLKVLTDRCMVNLNLPLENVIYEPFPKNTAPAVALLCHVLEQQGKRNEIVGVFPADHLVAKEKKFLDIVKLAEKCASEGKVVTLGIQPDHPSTGFGYIECKGEEYKKEGDHVVRKVRQFSEKPDAVSAKTFVESGNHFWNAGMFVFKVDTMIRAFEKYLPEVWKTVSSIDKGLKSLPEKYAQVSSVSIDKGIMEKLEEQVCIPSDIGWSDLGSWDDYAKMADMGVISQGTNRAKTVNVNSSNNFVFSVKTKTIALVGVEDAFVIETPDALLVGKKGSSQDTKKIVEQLEHRKDPITTDHTFDHRPWGKYEILSDGTEFKVKVIIVNPGQQLSYQSHTRRSEHWVIIEGSGEVVINEDVIPVAAGSSVVIPCKSKHRMRNTGTRILKFVEVQTGEYFGEDDIQRYEDDYNRA